ncbi:unnamed protein product [Amoebophrya sp. A25]|nr:unnamed protein product [Amoebophrya sp. A25]|eukprot:GSA25T00006585001.1
MEGMQQPADTELNTMVSGKEQQGMEHQRIREDFSLLDVPMMAPPNEGIMHAIPGRASRRGPEAAVGVRPRPALFGGDKALDTPLSGRKWNFFPIDFFWLVIHTLSHGNSLKALIPYFNVGNHIKVVCRVRLGPGRTTHTIHLQHFNQNTCRVENDAEGLLGAMITEVIKKVEHDARLFTMAQIKAHPASFSDVCVNTPRLLLGKEWKGKDGRVAQCFEKEAYGLSNLFHPPPEYDPKRLLRYELVALEVRDAGRPVIIEMEDDRYEDRPPQLPIEDARQLLALENGSLHNQVAPFPPMSTPFWDLQPNAANMRNAGPTSASSALSFNTGSAGQQQFYNTFRTPATSSYFPSILGWNGAASQATSVFSHPMALSGYSEMNSLAHRSNIMTLTQQHRSASQSDLEGRKRRKGKKKRSMKVDASESESGSSIGSDSSSDEREQIKKTKLLLKKLEKDRKKRKHR